MEQLGAVRIRSDVERKRLFGLLPEVDGQSGVGKGIYTTEATEFTYRKLEGLAAQILDAGYTVIVDAVFLNHRERERFRKLAETKQAPFVILECNADAEILRQRIVQRKKGVSDADLEIVAMQCSKWQPLHKDERINTVTIDTSVPVDIPLLAMQVKGVVTGIDFTAGEPLVIGCIRVIDHLVPGFSPNQLGGSFSPKPFRVIH